jgi:hypothetical protein
MLITFQRQDSDGNLHCAAINPKFITSAIYVERAGLTALNMHNQPTVWVTDSPSDVMYAINSKEGAS